MTNRSVEKWGRVSRVAVSASAAMSLALAFAGYASFVNTTEDNILNNFSTDHKPANVARGFLAVTMVSTMVDVWEGRGGEGGRGRRCLILKYTLS